jgi:HAD superfamily hydrolase (TIGR01509 family)
MFVLPSFPCPPDTRALLFDMDGVLLDTLSLDYELADRFLLPLLPEGSEIPRKLIRDHFAYEIPTMWRMVGDVLGIALSDAQIDSFTQEHEAIRRDHAWPVHVGVEDLLQSARDAGLACAVVSNNPEIEVVEVLERSSIAQYFDAVVGNDRPGLRKKPEPDPYLEGARLLGVDPRQCVVIEDSLLGAQAGRAAGCYVVGVATGATELDALRHSDYVDHACQTLSSQESIS